MGSNSLMTSSKKTLETRFKKDFGYELNLDSPKDFNEKIQWMKLYYRNPLLTTCSDKYLVRDYVKDKVGDKYLVPLVGVWDNVDDISFEKLPPSCILKTNWGCNRSVIKRNNDNFDIEQAKLNLERWMKPESNHYYSFLEWGYKNIEPKIICEYLIEPDANLPPIDYRFFCFNGVPKVIRVDVPFLRPDQAFKNKCRSVYDLNWNSFSFSWEGRKNIGKCKEDIKQPKNFKEMVEIVKILCKDFIFVRVDLYNENDSIYFGELTFYPSAGLSSMPTELNKILTKDFILPV